MSELPTRRRWFQFSLGTMLVLITVFAVWLGWELKFIRDRKEWLRENRKVIKNQMLPLIGPEIEPPIPIWRQWLGDKSQGAIYLPFDPTRAERDRAKSLFPEAAIAELNPPC